MTTDFDPRAQFEPDPATAAALWHQHGCGCALHTRRLFGRAAFAGSLAAGTALAFPAWAREGVQVDDSSSLAKLVPAEEIEGAATQQYKEMLQQAGSQTALAQCSADFLR